MAVPEDQMDQRFRELIKAEYGDVAGARAPDEPAPYYEPVVKKKRLFRPAPPDPIEYFNLSAAIEDAEPENPERWHPKEPEPIGPIRMRIKIALGMLAVVFLFSLAALFGFSPPKPVSILVALLFASGITILLFSIPKHWPERDIWEEEP